MQVEKLVMLSKHLRTLPDEQWYFGCFVDKVMDCGTVGCAIGHLPDLWPETWSIETTGRLNNRHAIVHEHLNTGDIMFAVGHFFGIDTLVAHNLFVMGYDCPMSKVTKVMVADAIDKYIMEEEACVEPQ